MMENFDISLIDWSRAQFAVTAIYHWLFVPLTLGLSFLVAIMETIYVKTGNPEWKRITKFWMTLFGINFAIGVATGIILEFEFGTNWSNYSWFVGDIFGAPLAVEGIMAFFIESTFIAVMFFGWNKVSKRFHLLSSWLTAAGANLSALWILVANSWMQYPAGMKFNPETARNEMVNFWDVLFSPVAVNKFLHTVSSGYVLAAVFVLGISSWFLLKKKEVLFASRSILVAAVFGLVFSLFLAMTGDGSARTVAHVQPMKFAAMENLYEGKTNAPLIAIGALKGSDENQRNHQNFLFKVEIPNLLSYMAFLSPDAFVPGIKDLVEGNPERGIPPMDEKIKDGKLAIQALADFKAAKKSGDTLAIQTARTSLEANFKNFGYGYVNDANYFVPPIPVTFYSFRIMVILGGYFIILFLVMLVQVMKHKLEKRRWLLWMGLISIPLAYLASESGWLVAEFGRQPWVIQDLMPTLTAVSKIDAGSVQLTFWLFVALFTILAIAEVKIMLKQIKLGPKEGGH